MPANLATTVTGMNPADGAYDADIAAEAEAWLRSLDDKYLACYRAHNFPKLLARNGRVPRGIAARPSELAGHMQIIQTCRDCGLRRLFTCTANDVFAAGRHYEYEYPERYNMPKGAASYITWADIQAERNRRFAEALVALAGAAA